MTWRKEGQESHTLSITLVSQFDEINKWWWDYRMWMEQETSQQLTLKQLSYKLLKLGNLSKEIKFYKEIKIL